jgi:hypothetical protein
MSIHLAVTEPARLLMPVSIWVTITPFDENSFMKKRREAKTINRED